MANIRQLDLNLLVILDALFREQSVTLVATQLGVSQPTVSQALGKLRAFFADDLFIRSRGGFVPTAFAATLREPLQNMMAIVEREIFPPVRFDPTTSRRTFTICMSDTGELCFLPALTRAIEKEAPHISIRTVTLSPAELKEAFAGGTVDLALGNFPDLDPAATGIEELTNDIFVCIARRGHPIARPPISLETFLSCDHAVVAARSRFQRLFEGAMERMGLELRVRLRPEHFVSLLFIVSSSDLIATVPSAVARAFCAHGDIVEFPLPMAVPPIVIAQHWHKRRDSDPEVSWLRALMRELFAGSSLAMVSAERRTAEQV